MNWSVLSQKQWKMDHIFEDFSDYLNFNKLTFPKLTLLANMAWPIFSTFGYGRVLGQKFFVRFLGELKKPKSPFEIN